MNAISPRPVPWLLRLKPPGSATSSESAESQSVGESSALERDSRDSQTHAILPADTLGLALSGGGIRSATFCLGILQAMARADWLRHVDYLSTVSGGGYVGMFLGRIFDLCHKPGGIAGAVPNQTPGAAHDRVAAELTDPRSPALIWLRRNSNYLSPASYSDALVDVAGFWRNFLAVQFVLALLFFALFGVVNAIDYSPLHGAVSSHFAGFVSGLVPLSANLPEAWASPWATLTELGLWLVVMPLMIAYWLVSQDQHESFLQSVLPAAALLAVSLLLATFSPVSIAVFAFAVLWALEAWAAIRRQEGQGNPASRFRLMLSRNHLTRRLAFCVAAMVTVAAFGFVDGLSRWLVRVTFDGELTAESAVRWFGAIGAALLSLGPVLRLVAGFFITRDPDTPSSLWTSLAKIPFLPTLTVLLFVVLPPLVILSCASHAAFELGNAWYQGIAATAVALVLCLLLGNRDCVRFVNRTGPLTIYAARLSRAFMGAVNPARRRHVEGRNVTHVVAGDDLPLDEYEPHRSGGPLHVMNCAVNETIDVASQRGIRDRKAENMAIGPAGVNVAQYWHALWTRGTSGSPALTPLSATNESHPFLAKSGGPVEVERLNVREWIGISGAAVSPGMGRQTGTAAALLYTLANLRLGYWWNSGLSTAERSNLPMRRGLFQKLKAWSSRWFHTQSLLLAELRGRFGGPWHRYWYLSDGGNFEITGAYELLRRRVPFVIVCDAGQDRKHQGSDIAGLVRLARVDLGAEMEEVDASSATLQRRGVPEQVAQDLGVLRDLLPACGALPTKHAALFSVRYPRGAQNLSTDPWRGRHHTWLLYIKATCTGDETTDLGNYRALHPDFPNESTLDQFFDESQWESYRKLGEHIGSKLFA